VAEPNERANPELVCTYDPLLELMARFENVRATGGTTDPFAGLGPDEVLKKHIIDGIKKSLEAHLDTALENRTPLSIINDVLLDGMKTVGELFGAGKMQLPFVLQSAEVMKAAVRYLEPMMERVEGSEKGSILLATVSGDVHDIGKNLVDIILTNNGYRVVNIGIKQPIENIIDQAVAHRCQVIGMSGLLVKSTVIMRENLLVLNERGLADFPVILGGAALTRSYVEQDLREVYQGQVHYAQDAFEGLRIMGDLESTALEDATDTEVTPRTTSHRVDTLDPALYKYHGVRSEIEPLDTVPELPFYGARKFERFDIFELYRYINLTALYRGQWQFKRPAEMGNVEFAKYLEQDAEPIFVRLQRELANVLRPRIKWGYFWCRSEGNDLVILSEDQKSERERFNFPRQRDGRRLCIADFFRSDLDVVGFHVVTAGSEVSLREQALFAEGDYQDYLFTHGMGVETAEALAEYWHQQIRREMKIDAEEPATMKELFGAKYRGARYAFGYPACPNLEDQAKLMRLLEPEDIGIELSEEFMLVPEQSTSAIIVHHPQAKYFNVK